MKKRKPKSSKTKADSPVFVAVVGIPKKMKGRVRATYKGKRIPIGFSA